jgi:CRISPR-associated exonuclease Cas4
MQITGTHFNYYMVCHRKLWLFSNSLQMEQTSDIVYEGKLIHETSYMQRSEKYTEVEIDGIKIDFYDAKNKVIHEVKKSNKVKKAHEWQLKYYMYILEKAGINGVTGILEYPRLRKKSEVLLSEVDIEEIKYAEKKIIEIYNSEKCPEPINSKICKKCSYYDFCYVNEE